MIKRTLFFTKPAYLRTKNEQLVVSFPDTEQAERSVPLEDIGAVVLEHQQITVSNALLNKLSQQKAAVISCNAAHLPTGLLLPMEGHTEYSDRVKLQIEASKPLKKNLWAQTVSAKILNQAALLKERGKAHERLLYLAKKVQSGDAGNCEAQAAAFYWQHLFDVAGFSRQPAGMAPNNLLNYGYAIIRAMVARAIISSGLLPVLGIWHRNKYNAYCLADDLMEPYRPYVDMAVCHIVEQEEAYDTLTTALKSELLQLLAVDVTLEGKVSPLMVAVSRTTNSLYECFAGISRKILYPVY
jgi:CRISPR-associated protein Cas1